MTAQQEADLLLAEHRTRKHTLHLRGSDGTERTLLSHRDLDISENEHAGLIRLQAYFGSNDPPKGELGFDMRVPIATTNCGTAACIGGHLSLLLQGQEPHRVPTQTQIRLNAASYVGWIVKGDALYPLFYPHRNGGDSLVYWWREITRTHAALAIRNFLTRGTPAWDEVCPAEAS